MNSSFIESQPYKKRGNRHMRERSNEESDRKKEQNKGLNPSSATAAKYHK